MSVVLIRLDDYERVRHLFSVEDKEALNDAHCGDCLCPRGIFVEVNPNTDLIINRMKFFNEQ